MNENNMNVLVCDTSSQALTTGLFTPSFKEVRTVQGRSVQHSERLIPTVLELCKDANIETSDIDLLICTRGPGSFTGLRIGMAAFKGMAFALDKPIVSVSTLEAYARCAGPFDGVVVPVIDAKKQRWYLSAFEKNSRLILDLDGTCCDIERTLSPYENILIIGPDANAFETELKSFYENKEKDGNASEETSEETNKETSKEASKETMTQNCKKKHIFVDMFANEAIASAIYKLGIEQYEKKGADDIGQGPVYLRKSDAELALEEKQAKEAKEIKNTDEVK